jgi:hypothetical protein
MLYQPATTKVKTMRPVMMELNWVQPNMVKEVFNEKL